MDTDHSAAQSEWSILNFSMHSGKAQMPNYLTSRNRKRRVVVLHGHTSIEVFHSLTPLLRTAEATRGFIEWEFQDYTTSNIFKASGDILILVRRYHGWRQTRIEMEAELARLRRSFGKIIYFDDSAATSIVLFNIFDYVDEYWKRAVFKNYENYNKDLYGGHLFSDYYHRNYGVEDGGVSSDFQRSEGVDFKKLRVAWNIGLGALPTSAPKLINQRYSTIRRVLTGLSIFSSWKLISLTLMEYFKGMERALEADPGFDRRRNLFSSRFESENYKPSIGYQRRLMCQIIEGDASHLTGRVGRWDFTTETFQVRGVLSPFGWGEVCYRDFEAVLGGAVLIKPDMSHVDTWPNIFTKNSYAPISWDLRELKSLSPEQVQEAPVLEAKGIYLEALSGQVARVRGLLGL